MPSPVLAADWLDASYPYEGILSQEPNNAEAIWAWWRLALERVILVHMCEFIWHSWRLDSFLFTENSIRLANHHWLCLNSFWKFWTVEFPVNLVVVFVMSWESVSYKSFIERCIVLYWGGTDWWQLVYFKNWVFKIQNWPYLIPIFLCCSTFHNDKARTPLITKDTKMTFYSFHTTAWG